MNSEVYKKDEVCSTIQSLGHSLHNPMTNKTALSNE